MLVPSLLKAKHRWVCWRAETRNGKSTKVPYRADGQGRAKTNDPSTWAAFPTERARFDGIGFVLGDGIVGIDVDIPVDDPLTRGVIEHFSGTYCERSPNGKLHVFALGSVARSGKGSVDKRFEAYDERSPRFLTVTGDHIEGTATEVTAQPEAIAWLEATYFAKPDPADKIIERVKADKKWRALFEGTWEGAYTSQSEADFAFCIILARLTRDPKLIDAVFRRSGLMDAKRDRPDYRERTIAEALKRTAEEDTAPPNDADRSIRYGGMVKRVTDMADINARYALLDVPGSPEAIINRKDGRALPIEAFCLKLGGEIVEVGKGLDGSARYMPADKFWRGSYNKHAYHHIDFTGRPVSDDTLNLFRGFGVRPKAGDCGLILAHIAHVVCNDDPVAYEALLNLIAWQLQNIGRPSRVAVCLQSEEHQTGKGTLLEAVLMPIYGAAGVKIENLNTITGDFNGALRGRAYVFADEATYLGDMKGAAVLKSLICTRVVDLNEKYLPRLNIPAAINIWMACNPETPIHIEEADGRYWLLKVNPDKKNDTRYFSALYNEINGGGTEAFLRLMLDRDVADWDPQTGVPANNAAKAAAIRESRNPGSTMNWLELCYTTDSVAGLRAGRGCKPWVADDRVLPWELIDAYLGWCKSLTGSGIRADNVSKFWACLSACGFGTKVSNSRRYRTLPPLEKVREYLKLP